VSDLHKMGFTNDFILSGNDLFWVQGKIFVRIEDFAILEYYKIRDANNIKNGFTAFGILAPYQGVKGILLNHCYRNRAKPVKAKKLKDMWAHISHNLAPLN